MGCEFTPQPPRHAAVGVGGGPGEAQSAPPLGRLAQPSPRTDPHCTLVRVGCALLRAGACVCRPGPLLSLSLWVLLSENLPFSFEAVGSCSPRLRCWAAEFQELVLLLCKICCT